MEIKISIDEASGIVTVAAPPTLKIVAASNKLVPGIYRFRNTDEGKRLLALCEGGTWFNLVRRNGDIDLGVLARPPDSAEIEIVPESESTQQQLALLEAISKLSTATEVWVANGDTFHRCDSGRTFQLMRDGAVHFEMVDFPTGARPSLTKDLVLIDLITAAESIDSMYQAPHKTHPHLETE